MTPAPERVERFRADLAGVWSPSGDAAAKLGLAVSGGGDSLALLLLAHAAIPGRIEVASVDHQLREGSAREAAYVAERCAELGVPCRILTVTPGKGNVQDRARAARYAALGAWCQERELEGLATAHQLDDQVETLFMRLNRGSGLSGLVGIRPQQRLEGTDVVVVRPLLGWRRDELAGVVNDAGWVPVVDPSNELDQFDRVRMRKALAAVDWLDRANIARSVALLGEAKTSLTWAAGREVGDHVAFAEDVVSYAALASGAPRSIRVEAIGNIFRHFGKDLGRGAVAELVDRLIAGETGNVGGLHYRVEGYGRERRWLFRPENPRRT